MQKSVNYKNVGTKYYLLGLLLFVSSLVFSQKHALKDFNFDNHFDGFYAGISIGSQNIFGGASIEDLDVLAQKSGLVVEIATGYRRQFLNNRLSIGAELQFGFTNTKLDQIDVRNQAQISYDTKSQFGYGLNLGTPLGRRKILLLFAYGIRTHRDFDIIIVNNNGAVFNQKDSQRFLRYGMGLELLVYKNFNVKGTVGRVYTNYDEQTNIELDNKFDFALGVVYQF